MISQKNAHRESCLRVDKIPGMSVHEYLSSVTERNIKQPEQVRLRVRSLRKHKTVFTLEIMIKPLEYLIDHSKLGKSFSSNTE